MVMSVPMSPMMKPEKNHVRPSPRRWTQDLARVSAVEAKEREGRIYVVWAGVNGVFWPWQLYKTPMSFYLVNLPPE